MTDPLADYLKDHLAGSEYALELLELMCERHRSQPLGEFAQVLKADIQSDQQVLREILAAVGEPDVDFTRAAGWLAEKASRFKLQRDNGSGLGTFEALETLTLGIRGKIGLWRALIRAREVDARIPALNYDHLIEFAKDQFRRTEQQRLLLIPLTFGRTSQTAAR